MVRPAAGAAEGSSSGRGETMSMTASLQPVDAADVTILVDNAIDILVPDTDIARRPPWVWEWSSQEQLRAEHGYSLLLTVHTPGRSDTILYDAGLGRDTAIH